jgi:hypothetical protein
MVLAAAALALGACTTTPVPSSTASLAPSPMPSAQNPATAGLVTDRVGRLSVIHPAPWHLTAGPAPVTGGYVPLLYLSNVALDVKPCPTPDPTTHVFNGCPFPVGSLAPNGVVVTIEPNGGLLALIPSDVMSQAADGECRAAGGERQVGSVVGAVVVSACLSGPSLDAEEAQVRAAIASLTGVF